MAERTLIIGNWKMHLNVSQASLLLHRLQERIRISNDIEVVLAPSMLVLQPLSVRLDRRKFRLAAQNAYAKDEGAFTGEVSFTMLRDLVHYVIIGHSERRTYFNETLPMIRDKVAAAVRNEIVPVLCVGETKQERKNGETRQVLHDQVSTALADLTAKEVQDLVIAYEPVWAIGKGDPAKPDQIEEAIAYIRLQIEHLYGKKAAQAVRVIYGASVEPEFTGGILQLKGVDGLLVGGASVNYHQFSAIVDAAYKLQRKAE
ncbi:MAG: triose-phosphate isomerase [Candidatus Saccharimonadales bacterium]